MVWSRSAYVSSSCCWYGCDNLGLCWLTRLFIEVQWEAKAALGWGSGPLGYNDRGTITFLTRTVTYFQRSWVTNHINSVTESLSLWLVVTQRITCYIYLGFIHIKSVTRMVACEWILPSALIYFYSVTKKSCEFCYCPISITCLWDTVAVAGREGEKVPFKSYLTPTISDPNKLINRAWIQPNHRDSAFNIDGSKILRHNSNMWQSF